MNLVIDFGNTFHKVAFFNNGELVEKATFSAFRLDAIQKLVGKNNPTSAILSSVANHPPDLEEYLHQHFFTIILSENTPLPIQNKYDSPETLGKDRLAAAVGAHAIFPQNDCLAVDAGTCITYEFVDKMGNYQGGAISPGIKMRFEALHNFTARLPFVDIFKSKIEMPALTGKTTEGSISSGVIHGVVAEFDGVIERYKSRYPALQILVTGGDASVFETHSKNVIFAAPNLVLTGLNQILEHNVS